MEIIFLLCVCVYLCVYVEAINMAVSMWQRWMWWAFFDLITVRESGNYRGVYFAELVGVRNKCISLCVLVNFIDFYLFHKGIFCRLLLYWEPLQQWSIDCITQHFRLQTTFLKKIHLLEPTHYILPMALEGSTIWLRSKSHYFRFEVHKKCVTVYCIFKVKMNPPNIKLLLATSSVCCIHIWLI